MKIAYVKPNTVIANFNKLKSGVKNINQNKPKTNSVPKPQTRHFDLYLDDLFEGNIPRKKHNVFSQKFNASSEFFINSLI